jgi:hypothetical protein
MNHQNFFATNLTSNVNAGDTTTPLNSIPSVDAPFYLTFDATGINGNSEVVLCTSKSATNVNHAALAYAHTTAEEVRMSVVAEEMNNLSTLQTQTNGVWVDWTPTWTNLTVGNGTVVAKYTQIGKTVHYYVKVTFGSTTSIAGSVNVSLPVTNILTTSSSDPEIGQILFRDASISYSARGVMRVVDGNTGIISVMLISSIAAAPQYVTIQGISATVPFTWTTSDVIAIQGTYEAA